MDTINTFTTFLEDESTAKSAAMCRLIADIQKGWDSAERDAWVSEEDAYRLLGIDVQN